MAIEDTIHVDAARITSSLNFVGDVNSKIDWNVFGPTLVVVAILLTIAIKNRHACAYYWARTPLALWWERRRMMRKREKELLELTADAVTDGVESLYFEKLITKEERTAIYFRLGKFYPDLLTAAQHMQLQEEEEKAQRKEEEAAQNTQTKNTHVHIL